jgi:hypothetical protein
MSRRPRDESTEPGPGARHGSIDPGPGARPGSIDPGPQARVRPYLTGSPVPPAAAGSEPTAPTLRPFILTSGRVPAVGYLEVETQVTTRVDVVDAADVARLPREVAAIVALCVEPSSVAEISATLHLHLGVTKVLVGDLVAAGYVDVYSLDVDAPVDTELILKVMRGLRALA